MPSSSALRQACSRVCPSDAVATTDRGPRRTPGVDRELSVAELLRRYCGLDPQLREIGVHHGAPSAETVASQSTDRERRSP